MNTNRLTYLIGGILTLLFFYLDKKTELGIAGGIPYILVIVIGFLGTNKRYFPIAGIITIGLVIWGFYLSPPIDDTALWKAITNRFYAVFAIGSVSVFSYIQKRNEYPLQEKFSDLLELSNQLKKNETSLKYAQKISHCGTWEWDITNDHTTWSDEQCRIYGYAPEEIIPTYELFINALHPEDKDRVINAVNATLNENSPFELEYRIIRPDKTTRNIIATGIITDSDKDEPVRMLCTNLDVTEYRKTQQSLQESEKLHRVILSSISDAVFITDNAGDFTFICHNVHVIFGYSFKEVKALKSIEKLLGKHDLIDKERLQKNKELSNIEHEIIDKFGKKHFLLVTAKKVRINGGRILFTCRDITERKKIQFLLEESEERCRLALDASRSGVWDWNIVTNEMLWSNKVESLFGLEANTFGNNYDSFIDFVYHEDVEIIEKAIASAIEGKCPYHVEYRVQWSNGNLHWQEAKGKVFYDLDGKPIRMMGTVIDITENKDFLAQIYKLSQALEQSPTPVMICDKTGRIEYVNKQFSDHYGYTKEEAIGKFPSLLSSGKHSKEFYEDLWSTISAKKKWEKEICNKTKNGELVWEIQSISPSLDVKGNITCFISIKIDISKRKKIEDTLIKYKILFDTISDLAYICNEKGDILYINNIFSKLTGYTAEEFDGKLFYSLFDANNLKKATHFHERTLKGESCKFELVFKNTNILCEFNNHPLRDENKKIVGVIGVARDITDRRKLEAEISNIEKLKSVGVLAGGIAHDFNNLLTIILGNIELAKFNLEPAGKIYDKLARAESASLRAKNLTQQLLTFSKGGMPVRRNVLLRNLIQECVKFCLSGSKSSYTFDSPDDLWIIHADKGQIYQVIQNIIINADQSISGEGGSITIIARNVVIGQEDNIPVAFGKYVKTSISDQGKGISKENLRRIFDPYFTTKKTGSGLGLSVCYSIIRKHGGHIKASSTPGKGTTFSFYLSVEEDINEEEQKERNFQSVKPLATGKILVMDDDEFVRLYSYDILDLLGHEVKTVEDGEKAVELYREEMEKKRGFDMVILDLTVPGRMGGKKTIKKLLEIDPQVKAVVSSGYAKDPVLSNYENYGFKAALVKPYTMADMEDVIEKILRSKE